MEGALKRKRDAVLKKGAADKLLQEGAGFFNQGRPSDALTKFKESLGYWSDATRTKYVSDLEARRLKAVALRDEGAKLQQQNRIQEAIAKYKDSQTFWPDPGLTSHIATLEGKLKQDTDTVARKAREWVSKGRFAGAGTVIATNWENGLAGSLQDNNNTIRWANGTTWYHKR